MTTKHTPGPWFAVAGMVEVDGDKADICSCYAEDFRQASIGRDPQEEWANARLIAAAPKMLAAGKHLAVKLAEVYRAAGQNPAKCQAISDWMAAVAEAEGRS